METEICDDYLFFIEGAESTWYATLHSGSDVRNADIIRRCESRFEYFESNLRESNLVLNTKSIYESEMYDLHAIVSEYECTDIM